uniref:substrate-binding domain-containing protein n=1 Tax=Piscibacillus halophilus TaxID=571933 RepID=UPI0024095792
ELVISGNYDLKKTAQATIDLLQNHPDIDGIFAGNDIMALGVAKAADYLNIKVPNELAIIGFDGINLSEMTSPELSTISQPIYEMSTEAARALISLIEGKVIEKIDYEFPFTLIQRQSTKR